MSARRTLLSVLALLSSTLVLASPAAAVGDKDCGDFSSQKAAQIFYLKAGGPQSDPHRLDSDSDGVACESNPAPYYYGTSLPGGSKPEPEPKPQVVKTSVGLVLDTGKAIRGEKVKLTASVTPKASRTVLFQRRSDGRWRTFTRKTSNSVGRAVLALAAPRSSVGYRVVVTQKKSGNTTWTQATSTTRSLTVQPQRVALDLSRTWIAEDDSVRATVTATPVRTNRPIEVQIYRNGSWRALADGRQSRRGVASFTLDGLAVGQHRLRAVVLPWHGAVSESSSAKELEVRDVSAPAAPQNVTATPGDTTVSLSWSPVPDSDVDRYVVYYRTDPTGSVVPLAEVTSTSFVAQGLTNGVTYWFSVEALDGSGNRSVRSSEVSATPAAPPVVE